MSVVRYLHIVSADLLLNSYTDCILIYHSYYSWTVQRIALKFSEQWLVLHYLFCFRGTAAKQLNWLNSKFILATTSQIFTGFNTCWILRGGYFYSGLNIHHFKLCQSLLFQNSYIIDNWFWKQSFSIIHLIRKFWFINVECNLLFIAEIPK